MTFNNVNTLSNFLIRLLQRAADWLAVRLLQIQDYFVPGNIRASEIFILVLSVLWLLWFVLFDIQNASPNVNRYIWNKNGWVAILTVFSILHLSGLFIPAFQLRQFGVFGYCVIWFFWSVIVGFSVPQSQIFPTCVCLFGLSIYVAVNVMKDTKHLERD